MGEKAERQKAEGKRQKAKGKGKKGGVLPFAFSVFPFLSFKKLVPVQGLEPRTPRI
jgi:hypothetical protein